MSDSALSFLTNSEHVRSTTTSKSKFELVVEGERYSGWKSIRLSRGVERAVSDFTLSVSEKWPLFERPEPWQIAPGSKCEIYIDNELILTGYTDSYQPKVDATSHAVTVSGRSKTMDFIDSSITVDGGQFKGMNVLQIARTLAKPFGIEVVAEVPSGDAVRQTTIEDELIAEPETQCQPIESCFDFVERLARLSELLITDSPDGKLVLTRAGNQKASDKLVQGQNVKSAGAKLDNSKRFSHYIVKAQRPGNRKGNKKTAKGAKDPWGGAPPIGGLAPEPAPATEPLQLTNQLGVNADALSREIWREQQQHRLQLLQEGAKRDDKHTAQRATTSVPAPFAEYATSYDAPEWGSGGDWDWEWEDREDEPTEWPGDGNDTTADRGSTVLSQVGATVRDTGITRYRPKVIIAEQQADDGNARKRADWEMRRRFARAHECTIEVVGWRQRDGTLWQPNMMVDIEMPWLSLERDMMISAVDYNYSEDGETCTFTCTLQDAFLPEKFRKAKGKAAAKSRKGRKGKAVKQFWTASELSAGT